MDYSSKEIELATKYSLGEINDIQLNFLAVQNETEKYRIQELAQSLQKTEKVLKNINLIIIILAFYLIYVWIF